MVEEEVQRVVDKLMEDGFEDFEFSMEDPPSPPSSRGSRGWKYKCDVNGCVSKAQERYPGDDGAMTIFASQCAVHKLSELQLEIIRRPPDGDQSLGAALLDDIEDFKEDFMTAYDDMEEFDHTLGNLYLWADTERVWLGLPV